MAARLVAVVAALCLLPASLASAAQIDATTTSDVVNDQDGVCSLREAITAANEDDPSGMVDGECAAGNDDDDTIVLLAGQTYEIELGGSEDANATGDFDVTESVTIEGAGRDSTTIDANTFDRVLHFIAGTSTLSGVTITGGLTPAGEAGAPETGVPAGNDATGESGDVGGNGGGVLNEATLTIDDSRITQNTTGNGGVGGHADAGDATLVSGGQGGLATGGNGGSGGNGGGIASTGTLTLVDSEVTENLTGIGGDGGNAVGGDGATAINDAGGEGGAGDGGDGGNGGSGGGIAANGTLTITRSTIADNRTGDGTFNGSGTGGAGGQGINNGVGGVGGAGTAGNAGDAGTGGGVAFAGALAAIEATTIRDNETGSGGQSTSGFGGAGGSGGGSGADGGNGGEGVAGDAGTGGVGGGLGGGATTTSIEGSAIVGNVTGTGGIPSSGIGGNGGAGGAGGAGGDGGDGGNGSAGDGASAGIGGGLFLAQTATIDDSTISANETGAVPEVATSGVGGVGGPGGGTSGDGGDGGDGIGADGADGTPGGGLQSMSTTTIRHVTVTLNSAETEGDDGAVGILGGGGEGAGSGQNGDDGAAVTGDDGDDAVGGGLSGDLDLGASIVSDNLPENCSGGLDDDGDNLTFPDTGCPGDVADPLLDPLTDNGGPTPTHMLGAGSAALDGVSSCAGSDQRGFARAGATCDIGAVEASPPAVTTGDASAITTSSATVGASVTPNARETIYRIDFGTTDGYGLSTPDADAGDGAGAVGVSAELAGLAPSTTYHYRVVAESTDGAAVGEDRTFTTAAVPGPGPGPGPPPILPDTTAPRFLSAAMSPAAFRVDPSGAREVAVTAQTPRGTTFRYTLSEAARVVFTIRRARPGRRVGRRCRAPSRSNRGRRRCTRFVLVGRFAQQASAAPMIKPFSGRIGRRSLRRGRHRAVLVATDAAGNRSAARRLSFRVARRRV